MHEEVVPVLRTDDARPDTLVYMRVDAVAAAFGAHPHDAPWAREVGLRDPDGNRLRIGSPHPEDRG